MIWCALKGIRSPSSSLSPSPGAEHGQEVGVVRVHTLLRSCIIAQGKKTFCGFPTRLLISRFILDQRG